MSSIHPISALAGALAALAVVFAAGVGIALVSASQGAQAAQDLRPPRELPREWRWEPPSVSFEGMFRQDRGHRG